jgi:hypothetical protein
MSRAPPPYCSGTGSRPADRLSPAALLQREVLRRADVGRRRRIGACAALDVRCLRETGAAVGVVAERLVLALAEATQCNASLRRSRHPSRGRARAARRARAADRRGRDHGRRRGSRFCHAAAGVPQRPGRALGDGRDYLLSVVAVEVDPRTVPEVEDRGRAAEADSYVDAAGGIPEDGEVAPPVRVAMFTVLTSWRAYLNKPYVRVSSRTGMMRIPSVCFA